MTVHGQPRPSPANRKHLAARGVAFVAVRSLRRLIHSTRGRFVLLGIALFDVVVIAGLVKILTPWFDPSDVEGGLLVERRLWLSCLVSWAGASGLAILVALQEGFGVKAILTFTLPVPSSIRLRMLYGNLLLQLANLWIIGGFGIGIALVRALGSQGGAWLALFLIGDILAVLGSVLLLSTWLLRLELGGARVALIAGTLVGAGAVLATRWGLTSSTVPPELAAAVCLVLLVVGVGPLAGTLGELYARAFHVTQGAAPRAVRRRTLEQVARWLLRFRSPGAALFVKDLLTRSRHWANWGRVALAAVAVLAFPLLRDRLRYLEIDDSLLVSAFVVGGILVTIIDGASSPLGSEGNRLALLLAVPIRRSEIIRAKLAAFVVPLTVVAVTTSAGLSLAVGLDGPAMVHVCFAVLLMVVGIAALFVFGSAFDADLDLEIHGGLQGLLYEETPFSPVRLALAGFGIGLCVLELITLACLSAWAAHLLLLALDATLLATGHRIATSRLDAVQSRR